MVDSFSTDRTVHIAKQRNARVIRREFDDFSSQKNFAISHAKYEWILFIDADERVSHRLGREILRTIEKPGDKVAFFVYRNLFFKEKRIRFGGWQTDKAIRLFRKGDCRFDGKLVHETIETEGPVGFLKNRLDHYSYKSRLQYSGKLEKYAALQAEELFRQGIRTNGLLVVIKPWFRFFVHYVWRLGFLDGSAGFVLAYEHAMGVKKRYSFLKGRYAIL